MSNGANNGAKTKLKTLGDIEPCNDRIRVCRTISDAPKNAWALYSECPTKCRAAKVYKPRPHSSSMKPICATVDQASRTLMLMRVSITIPANTAVASPKITNNNRAIVAFSSMTQKRINTKHPKLITPACSKADTGVGASMTWVNHPCTGSKAVRKMTASTNTTALTCSPVDIPWRAMCSARVDKDPLPTSDQASVAAMINSASAKRSARRFLCAASRAKGRSG